MKFSMTIDMDNAAFDNDWSAELADMLRKLADRVARGADDGTIHDSNGNRVGSFQVEG